MDEQLTDAQLNDIFLGELWLVHTNERNARIRSGADEVRLWKCGGCGTMDLHPTRLNLELNDCEVIVRAWWG